MIKSEFNFQMWHLMMSPATNGMFINDFNMKRTRKYVLGSISGQTLVMHFTIFLAYGGSTWWQRLSLWVPFTQSLIICWAWWPPSANWETLSQVARWMIRHLMTNQLTFRWSPKHSNMMIWNLKSLISLESLKIKKTFKTICQRKKERRVY